jgi:DNA polymerase III delta subunit
MLYFLYGDTKEVRKNLIKHLDSLTKKRPDAEVFRVKTENYSKDFVLELLSSQGLFSKKYIVVMDGLLENEMIQEEITSLFEEFKNTEHIFIFAEQKLNKKNKDLAEKFSEKVWNFEEKEKPKAFDPFVLANCLGDKDKKNLWVNFVKMYDLGVGAEEIIGMLFWQMKSIYIAKNYKEKESKLSPFVYKKTFNFSKKWQNDDILKKADRLVEISELVRDGEGDSFIYLESFILNI